MCTILSLPVPSKSVTLSAEGEATNKDIIHKKTFYKFLLLGSVNSGACTIFKQVLCFLRISFHFRITLHVFDENLHFG